MKFKIKDLGRIRDADIELNDLTIIAGPNNSGKTYATYSIYGFLKVWKELISFEKSNFYTDELVSTGTIEITTSELKKNKDKIFESLSSSFSNRLPDIFNDKEGNLKSSKVFLDKIDWREKKTSNRPNVIKIGESIRIEGTIISSIIRISIINLKNEKLPPKIILRDLVNRLIGELILDSELPTPFIFTSERLGISLFYKELDAAKSALVGELQRIDKDNTGFNVIGFLEKLSSWYATPIKDDIQFTRAIEKVQKNSKISEYQLLCERIKRMMGGYYRHSGTEIRFISQARKDQRFDIPLYLASSSARGLMSLYFFLKHVAHEGMIMIIDEPESHLNPSNQIEFARIIAQCVNSGLKVLITTHSDYFVKEFNNLIMLFNDFKGKEEFLKRYSKYYSKEVLLNPKLVNAYICSNGSFSKCEIDVKGIKMENFDNTIEEINLISDELDFLTDQDAN